MANIVIHFTYFFSLQAFIDTVNTIIEKGANVNHVDMNDDSPIIWAATYGKSRTKFVLQTQLNNYIKIGFYVPFVQATTRLLIYCSKMVELLIMKTGIPKQRSCGHREMVKNDTNKWSWKLNYSPNFRTPRYC